MFTQENKTGPISKSVTHFSKKSFFSEIPEEVRKESIVGENLSFFKKIKYFRAAIDRKKWEKVEDSAKNADKTLESINTNDNEDKTKDAGLQNDSIQNLNKSCFEYIDENKEIGFETKDEMEKANKNNQSYDANGLKIGAHGRKMKNLIKKRLFTSDKLIRKSVKMLNPQMSSFDLITGQTFKRDTKITLKSGLDFVKQRDSLVLFPNGDPKPEDLRQGLVGDCWLQASLISFLTAFGPAPIKKIFTDLGGGKVAVKIHDAVGLDEKGQVKWEPKTVLVNKQIVNYKYYNESDALWSHILQQAVIKSNVRNHYNKLFGKEFSGKEKRGKVSYDVIASGNSQLAAGILFGSNDYGGWAKEDLDKKISGKNETETFERRYNGLYDYISNLLKNGQSVQINFKNNGTNAVDKRKGLNGESRYKGLAFNHEYALVDCEESSDGEKWIYLVNPWSNRNGVEYFYDAEKKKYRRSKNMKSYSENEKNNGRFKLKMKTAYKYLGSIKRVSNNQ